MKWMIFRDWWLPYAPKVSSTNRTLYYRPLHKMALESNEGVTFYLYGCEFVRKARGFHITATGRPLREMSAAKEVKKWVRLSEVNHLSHRGKFPSHATLVKINDFGVWVDPIGLEY